VVTSENEPKATTAMDAYRQAREQAAAQAADYDVERGLDRLSAWLQDEQTPGSGLHLVQANPTEKSRDKRVRVYPQSVRDLAVRSEADAYRSLAACDVAGITTRQLDYWARTGLVEPSVRAAHGPGSYRLYSLQDIVMLKTVKRLLDTGIPLQRIRPVLNHLRDRSIEDLGQVTLMSDGVSVYECTSPDEVVALLAGGQGVFGIAMGRLLQEVAGELAKLPSVPDADGDPVGDRRVGTSRRSGSGNAIA